MVFALGGPAALEEMAKAPFDVVVSDMRMPGMDGATLLAKVKERHPATARIILSGHSEREAVVNALPISHQFLSKPCEAEHLRAVVERACGLQRLLHDESVRNTIGAVDRLPSVPETYLELTRAASKENLGLSELAGIVEKDPALALRVLQLANSAFFGQAKPRTSVRDAVSFLGTEVLKGLALSASVFAAASAMAVDGLSHEDIQRHSMDTARVARRFIDDKDRAAVAFTGGLLHDVGRIVLAMSVRERYGEVLKRQKTEGGHTHVLEREMLGASHSEVGGYLLGLWGLPLSLVEAVAYHHEPSTMAEAPPDVVMAVHVADAFATAPASLRADPTLGGHLDLAAVERAGLQHELPRWRAIAVEELPATGGA